MSIYADVCDPSAAVDRQGLLLRLARDRRMKDVWDRLYKPRLAKEGKNKQFLLPPRFGWIGYAKARRWGNGSISHSPYQETWSGLGKT